MRGSVIVFVIVRLGGDGVSEKRKGEGEGEGEGGEELECEISYDTWGNFGQYYREMAILRGGRVVDACEIARETYRGEKSVRYFGGVPVRVIDKSSFKNKHVKVKVPRSEVVAVVEDERTSSGWKGFSLVEGKGRIIREASEEESFADNKKVITEWTDYYYEDDEVGRVRIGRRFKGKRSELTGKPKIKMIVWREEGEIYLEGDTYYLKDYIKSIGGVWHPYLKRWSFRGGVNPDELREEMSKLADVEFVEVGKSFKKDLGRSTEGRKEGTEW